MNARTALLSISLIILIASFLTWYSIESRHSIVVRANDYTISAAPTQYVCYTKTVLPADEEVYITGFSPILDEHSEAFPFIHHYVLSIEDPFFTEGSRICGDWPGQPIYAWTTGEKPLRFPDGVGLKLGSEHPTRLTLQVHYDNFENASGVVDNNGVELFIQKEKPEHEAAMLTVGSIFEIEVPAHTTLDYVAPRCTAEETSRLGPITIFASFLHAHETARSLWMNQYRNGVLFDEINRDEYFDFETQRFSAGTWNVQPKDELEMHCLYENTSDTVVTGGPSSADEMCLNFMLYYPKTPYSYCGGFVEPYSSGLH